MTIARSSVSPAASRNRRRLARRGGGRLPPSAARISPAPGPLSLIAETAERPASVIGAKIVRIAASGSICSARQAQRLYRVTKDEMLLDDGVDILARFDAVPDPRRVDHKARPFFTAIQATRQIHTAMRIPASLTLAFI